MTRALVLVVLAIVFHALEAGLAVSLGVSDLPLVPGVVLLVYAILVEPPVEAAVTALALGFAMDALTGTPLGLHMVACLLTLLGARFFADTVTSPRSPAAFLFAMGCSAAYHTVAIVLLLLFAGHRESLGVGGILMAAGANGVLSLMVFPPIRSLLIWLDLEKAEVSFEQRLAHQAQRRKA